MAKPTHFAAVGDIHGDYEVIRRAIQKNQGIPVRSVGDMGLGYTPTKRVRRKIVPAPEKKDPEDFGPSFKFLRGNHDRPDFCRSHPNYLGDYGSDPETGIFFVSGARTEHPELYVPFEDWWPDEELPENEHEKIRSLYRETQPQTVISHDCPKSLYQVLKTKHTDVSRTCHLLQELLEIHRPRIWVFGHHHKVWRKNLGGTEFFCAATNQTLRLPIP